MDEHFQRLGEFREEIRQPRCTRSACATNEEHSIIVSTCSSGCMMS